MSFISCSSYPCEISFCKSSSKDIRLSSFSGPAGSVSLQGETLIPEEKGGQVQKLAMVSTNFSSLILKSDTWIIQAISIGEDAAANAVATFESIHGNEAAVFIAHKAAWRALWNETVILSDNMDLNKVSSLLN